MQHWDDSLTELLNRHIRHPPSELFHPELIRGAMDVHTHSSPSVKKRKYSDIGYAQLAKENGMRGIVIKAHEGDTAARAALVREVVPDLAVIGGVVLNRCVGGLNLDAVITSQQMGGKFVWFPTVDADNHLRFIKTRNLVDEDYIPGQYGGITVLDANGDIKPEVLEILEYVSKTSMVLASGHLSPVEIKALMPFLSDFGITKFVVQHPDLHLINLTVDDQVWLAQQGCYIEKCLLTLLPDYGSKSVQQFFDELQKLDPKNMLLVTDFGQWENPTAVQGLDLFIHLFLRVSYPVDSLKVMLHENPGRLLDLDEI